MLHYHGTPITPRSQLLRMAGRNFCVSFAEPRDLTTCIQIGQSVMFDNGAFSAFTKGMEFDEHALYRWLEPNLAPPHWAVVPDVIDGNEDAQRTRAERWPFPRELGMPVWHLGLSIDYLLELADAWPRICFGSTAKYWNVGSPEWCGRMDEAFNALAKRFSPLPWVHGLRMLGMSNGPWPLASADSTNVAQNFKRDVGCAECKAAGVDSIQPSSQWMPRAIQGTLVL